MKKILPIFLLFLAFKSNAQLTAGTLVYEISEEYPLPTNPYSFPTPPSKVKISIEFNADLMRVKSNEYEGYEASYLDRKSNTMIVASSPEGQKTLSFYQLDFTSSYAPDYYSDTVIVGLPESKKILGYNCKRTIYEISNGTIVTVWTTNEIKNADGFRQPLKGIEGETILECTIVKEESTVTQKVLEVIPSTEDLSIPTSAEYKIENPDLDILAEKIRYSQEDIPDLVEFAKIKSDFNQLYPKLKEFEAVNAEMVDEWEEMNFPSNSAIHVELSETGKVTDIKVFGETLTDKQEEKLAKIFKKQKWSPAKLKGKAMPSYFTIHF